MVKARDFPNGDEIVTLVYRSPVTAFDPYVIEMVRRVIDVKLGPLLLRSLRTHRCMVHNAS